MLFRKHFHVDESLLSSTGVIYVLVFDGGKMYIGQTKRSLRDRLGAHTRSLRQASCRNTKLVKALKKYVTCSCFVIHYGKSEDELNRIEAMAIDVLDTINNGYNSMIGGRNVRDHNHRAQKKLSTEHRKKIGIGNSKKVINLDTGKVFNSATEAAKSVGGEQRKLATNLKKGFRFKGYRFCYLSRVNEFKFKPKQKRSVMNVQTGQIFESIVAAGKSVNRHPLNIQSALRSGGMCGKYNWIRF